MMELITASIKDIKPYDKNPRKNNSAVEAVMESIKQCSYVSPIVVDEDMIILAGHTRFKALKKLGRTECEVIIKEGLTEEQKRKYRILDNKTNELALWDDTLLAEELIGLDFDGFDFGFDIKEEPTEVVEDDVPEIDEESEPITKLGDIWQLGRHRLMCGSSTDEADVARLMNGNSAKILFTSPPYSDMREYNGGKDLSVDNIARFISTYRAYTDYQCVNLGLQWKNHEVFQYWDEYIDIARNSGYKLLAWNIWDKLMCGSIGQQKAFFPNRHEWIFVFGTEFFEINQTWEKKAESIKENKRRAVRNADGSFSITNTGDCTNKYKQMESVLPMYAELGQIRSLHPATFPVGLPSEYIKAMTKKGDGIIEPFCGSGTTLIACEQLDRVCYGMELDPKYCDVIIRRWENLTGEKAVLING